MESNKKDIEYISLIERLNDTSHELSGKYFTDMLEESFRKYPSKTAVLTSEREYTYSEFEKTVKSIASFLRKKGAGRNSAVAVMLRKGYEQIASVMGIVYSGAAYVPVEYDIPAERAADCIAQTDAKILLADRETKERLAGFIGKDVETFLFEDIPSADDYMDTEPPVHEADDLFYVIFTSGSTGRPKGVMVSQLNIANFLEFSAAEFGTNENSRSISVTNFCHDMNIYELFGPLAVGGSVVMPDAEKEKEPAHWAELIARFNADMWDSVPTLMNMMLLAAENEDIMMPSMKSVILGGEFVPPSVVRKVKQFMPNAQVYSIGGPTETSVWNIFHKVTDKDLEMAVIPYGTPAWNTKFHILGEDLEGVAPGEIGTIYNSGLCVSKGYTDPELTKEKYIIHPVLGVRMYNTGDLGRWNKDGYIEIHGRADLQVKIQGKRIELGEIESCINGMDIISSSAVVAKDNVISAFCTLKKEGMTEHAENTWSNIFDETYADAEENPTDEENFGGWINSYTHDEIPVEQMRDWRDNTVRRIQKLPCRKIFEVGCGTGLLLHKLAPGAEKYVGIDISNVAVNKLRHEIEEMSLDNTFVYCDSADRLSAYSGEKYDTIIINSVIFFFYDLNYLLNVVKQCCDMLEDGGALFVGDVINKDMAEMFHTSIELFGKDSYDPASVREIVTERCSKIKDLLVTPSFFIDAVKTVEGFTSVRIDDKESEYDNELTRFRFDAVLFKGTQQKADSVRRFDISQDDISDEALLEMVSTGEEVCLSGMRNGFISRHYEDYCNVFGKSTNGLSSLRVSYPYRWYKLASDNDIDCICFTDRESRMTVRLGKDLRTDIKDAKVIDIISGEYTNIPYKENVYEGVSEEIRKYISRFLPDYMIPSAITVLDDLPRLDNGKTDRRALAAMVKTDIEDDVKVSTDDVVKYTEHLWRKLLRTDKTEYDISFFMLGGHSLIAMQLLNNIKTDLRINVRLSEFMKQPTLRNLIDTIQSSISENSFVAENIEDESYDENAPFELTDLQQSYYVGRQSGMKLGGMPTHVYTELICSDYDHSKLTETFNILIKRHDILRCVFDDNGMQRVLPEASIGEIPYEDISSFPDDKKEELLEKKRHDINFQILDMTKAPLIGVYVTKYSEGRHIISIYFDSMIIDGWSFNNLIYEIDLIYREGAGSLPVLKNSFRKYMAHRNNIYSEEEKKAASAYWDEKIKTFSGPPELPVKTDPHSLEMISYHRESRRISDEVWEKLKAKANAEGLSPFVVLLTAYCRTLSYYSSSEEFLVNIPVSTRAASGLDLDDVAGDFSDFMIVNVKDSKTESFFETASRIRDDLYEMQENMAVTGTDVVRRINRMNGGTNGLLAPVVFTSIAETGRPDNKTLLCDYFESHTNLIWIDFVVTKCTGFVSISIDYVEQLFEDYLMSRIADTYLDIIEEFVADSDSWKNVTHITLCDRDREIIASVNDAVYIPPEITYAEMIRRSIASHGKKTAVYTDKEDYSYEKFFGMVSSFAENFTGTGKRVAVLAGKGIKLFVAAAAAVLSGNVYVPLDYDYPDEIMKACLEDLSPEYIAADSKWADKASRFSNAKIIDLDTEELRVHSPEQIHFIDKQPEDIFCIIHTSGSTGKPKGIELREESLLACFTDSEKIFGINDDDCILALTNHCHDMSLFDIFAMYTYGAAVCVIDHDKWKDPTAWGEAILAHNVTMWNSVPSFMQILLDISGDKAGEIIGRLRTVIHGGDKFEPSEAEKLSRLNPDCALFNVGGPSETTIWNIAHRITQKDVERGDIPYGKPIPGSKYYILDSALQSVPVGVEGNMYIGGIGVSGGYINAAESNKNFIATEDKGVIFNCGDRGFVGTDGEIYFRGRIDDQVKINGKRIELDGVKSAALSADGVSDSSVLFVKETLRIILFYVSDVLEADDLKNALRKKLPDHMIPSVCIKVEKIPYTHAGKADKKALLSIFDEYEASLPQDEKEYDTDENFMDICRKCLDEPNIAPSDNFFAVGGNSVTAIKLLACIRQTYGAELGFDSIFNAPIFGDLYERVKNSASVSSSEKGEEHTVNSGRYPLSFSQEGVWFDKLMGDDFKNVIGLILRLTGEVDIDRLEAALDKAIKHFSMIRTAVRTDEDHRPYQTICPPEDLELDYDDISEEDDRDELLNEYYNSYAHSEDVFDFENGRLYRFVLLKTGENEYQLLCAFHHIICDDISIKVFTKYIENEYYGISCDEAEDNHFLAHALSERKISGEDIDKLGIDISQLRLIELPDRVSGSGYVRHSVKFTGKTAEKIAVYCTEHSITESIFMLTVYAKTLSTLTNEKIIPIGFPVSKREASKQDTFGMYINMSVVTADCSGSFTDIASCVRDHIFKVLSTEMVTFNKIAEYYGLSHDIRRLPFRFTYNYLFENKTDKRIRDSIFNDFEYLITNGHDDAGLLVQHEKDTITAEFSTVGYIDRAYLEKIGELYREIAESIIN